MIEIGTFAVGLPVHTRNPYDVEIVPVILRGTGVQSPELGIAIIRTSGAMTPGGLEGLSGDDIDPGPP